MRSKLLRELCVELPTPIAVVLMRALTSVDGEEEFKNWTNVLEVFTRYLSAIAFAEYCSVEPDQTVDSLICDTETAVGNGKAVNSSIHIYKYLHRSEYSFYFEIEDWLITHDQVSDEVEHLRALIAIRNNYIHRKVPPHELNVFIDGLAELLSAAKWLVDCPLFVVLNQHPNEPKGFGGAIRWLMGVGTPDDVQDLTWDCRLYNTEIYLLVGGGRSLLRLYPFLDWAMDDSRYEMGVFLWEKRKRRAIHYCSVRSPAERTELIAHQNLLLSWNDFLLERPHSTRLELSDSEIEALFPELDQGEDDSEDIANFSPRPTPPSGFDGFSRVGAFLCVAVALLGIYFAFQDEVSIPKSLEPVPMLISLSSSPELTAGMTLLLDGEKIEAIDGFFQVSTSISQSNLSLFKEEKECRITALDEDFVFTWDCVGLFTYPTVEIDGGYFWMGAPKSMLEAEDDEKRREVILEHRFAIGIYEVTQTLWSQIMRESPSTFHGCIQCPVETVSWYEAVNFSNILSQKEGLEQCYTIKGTEIGFSGIDCTGWRLPTEAEWEFTARSGRDFYYSGSQNPVTVANFMHSVSEGRTIPVGSLRPNEFGIYDMSGNVYEWVYDWYGDYVHSGKENPIGPSHGIKKVGRGGGYSSEDMDIRVTNRASALPETRQPFIGLRLLRTVVKP